MKLFEDFYASMYEPFELPVHDTEDCRGAGHHEEDQWSDDNSDLFSMMFTVPEIIEFVRMNF